MKGAVDLVIFTLDESRFALQLSAVERVVRVVEITPLPEAPDIFFLNFLGNNPHDSWNIHSMPIKTQES